MYFLVSFVTLLGLVGAHNPKPCETPKQWTGNSLQRISSLQGVVLNAKISYDAINERVRILEENVYEDGTIISYDFILLFKEKKFYEIDLSGNNKNESSSNQCFVSPFEYPFQVLATPDDAKLSFYGYLGGSTSGTGVLVNSFYGRYDKTKVYYENTLTYEDCVPVFRTVYSKRAGKLTASYFNVMLGTEPNVFLPPKNCQEKPRKQGFGKILNLFPRRHFY